MSAAFHDEPFDEGTLTKLELFERYAEAWLPVFVARDPLIWHDVNIYDFFAGAGTDSKGVEGSPLRLLRVLNGQRQFLSRPGLKVTLHLSDTHAGKIKQLTGEIEKRRPPDLPLEIETQRGDFATQFEKALPGLSSRRTANLLIIDQFGIKEVPDGVFERIIDLSTTDVLFFVSSNTYRRFERVPEVQRLLLPDYQKPEDHYRAHLAVAAAYRALIPVGKAYHIASFSIKKGANVYGVIFGSGHPLGMDKFLEVAWNENKVTGDANFDVHREGIHPEHPSLFSDMNVPSKVRLFEELLEEAIVRGSCSNEKDIIELCHRGGVLRKHASAVLTKLKAQKRIQCDFKVPDIDKFNNPRAIKLL